MSLFAACDNRTAQTRVVVEHVLHAALVVDAELFLADTELVHQTVIYVLGTFLAQALVALAVTRARVGIAGDGIYGIRVARLDDFGQQSQVGARLVMTPSAIENRTTGTTRNFSRLT